MIITVKLLNYSVKLKKVVKRSTFFVKEREKVKCLLSTCPEIINEKKNTEKVFVIFPKKI